jgi:hypothetical protein
MIAWLALGLVILGVCTMVGAAVLANIVFFRYPLTCKLSIHNPAARRAADLVLAKSLLRCAALTLAGATVLVLGLVVGRGSAAWTLVIPLGPLLFVAVALVYLNRVSERADDASS